MMRLSFEIFYKYESGGYAGVVRGELSESDLAEAARNKASITSINHSNVVEQLVDFVNVEL